MDLAASPAVADVWPESRASSVTPTDEASSDDEGDAVVVHTTNTVTEHIRPQRRAAGRKAADAGPCEFQRSLPPIPYLTLFQVIYLYR